MYFSKYEHKIIMYRRMIEYVYMQDNYICIEGNNLDMQRNCVYTYNQISIHVR